MKVELKELEERIDKLEKFMRTETFSQLAATDRGLLVAQHSAMTTYGAILVTRMMRMGLAKEVKFDA